MLNKEESKENFLNFLTPTEKKYTKTPLYEEVYNTFCTAYISKAHHHAYIQAYYTWKNFITMEELKNAEG